MFALLLYHMLLGSPGRKPRRTLGFGLRWWRAWMPGVANVNSFNSVFPSNMWHWVFDFRWLVPWLQLVNVSNFWGWWLNFRIRTFLKFISEKCLDKIGLVRMHGRTEEGVVWEVVLTVDLMLFCALVAVIAFRIIGPNVKPKSNCSDGGSGVSGISDACDNSAASSNSSCSASFSRHS